MPSIRAETITYRSKGAYIGGGGFRMCKACSIGAHYDVHLLLRRVLTSNPFGFLTNIIAEA